MKKVIRGRMYDTDTAIRLYDYEYSNITDFNHFSETLYRKRTGEYFLHGYGGPLSEYRIAIEHGAYVGSATIKPLTLKEAEEWGEKYMDGDEYEKIFGFVDEDSEKRTVSISITGVAHNILKDVATEREISVSALIEELAKTLEN